MALCYRQHNLSSRQFFALLHTTPTFLIENTCRHLSGPTCSAIQPLTQSRVYCNPHNTCTVRPCCFTCTNKHEYHLETVNNKSKRKINGFGINENGNM